MVPPKQSSIARMAIFDILTAMNKQDTSPCSAEAHLSRAIVTLNQIAEITPESISDDDIRHAFLQCRSLILGK